MHYTHTQWPIHLYKQCQSVPLTDVESGLAAELQGTMVNVTPSIDPAAAHERYNYLALICGVPLILIIILGNVLVCLSVLTERSLKTATNYFIVSLAVADLLLAVLVLPLYVYSEVSANDQWETV